MPVDGKLLEILCCPVSRTPLTRLSPDRLERLNRDIAAGEVRHVNSEPVQAPLEEALITEDDKVIYPVTDGIPVLLEDQGIGTTPFQDF